MTTRAARRADPFPALGAVIAVVMVGVYVAVMRDQGSRPLAWVLLILAIGALAAGYGSVLAAPMRGASLTVGGIALLALGVLALASIGLPIMVAGGLTLAGAARSSRPH